MDDKVLRDWNNASQYLNEKIEKNKVDVLEETVPQSQFVAENLISVPYYRPSGYTSVGGVTIYYDENGITTFTGSASLRQFFALNNEAIKLDRAVYILHGCPKGGSASTENGNYCIAAFTNSGGVGSLGTDTGEGLIIDNRDGSIPEVFLRFYIRTAEGLTFYPMLEKGTVTHEFQPYRYSRPSLEERITALESALLELGELVGGEG